ncbi:MAG: hypothetical protein EZS28_008904 [Streblomastix strix]|uniref:Uncharacterized protein n=1 Tax=Streblomastix strix TaxID=222440 RepID=A0A5J4WKP0_9EUKA|nr:MAG: hypothetical protein EZS28_008904 [Streblomastix strix]
MEEYAKLEERALKMPDKERRKALIQAGSADGVLDHRNKKDYDRKLAIMFEYFENHPIQQLEQMHDDSDVESEEQSSIESFQRGKMQKEPTTMLQSASQQSLQQLQDDDSDGNMLGEEEDEDEIQSKPRRGRKAPVERTQQQASKQQQSVSSVRTKLISTQPKKAGNSMEKDEILEKQATNSKSSSQKKTQTISMRSTKRSLSENATHVQRNKPEDERSSIIQTPTISSSDLNTSETTQDDGLELNKVKRNATEERDLLQENKMKRKERHENRKRKQRDKKRMKKEKDILNESTEKESQQSSSSTSSDDEENSTNESETKQRRKRLRLDLPPDVAADLERIKKEKLLSKQSGKVLKATLTDLMGVDKNDFDPVRWLPPDAHQELLKIRWKKKKIWKTYRVYPKSYVEFGDEYADLVQAAVSTQEAALTTMLAIISKEPAFESAKQMYVNATITATYAQKMRDIRNTFGKGKAIAAGKVGPSQVVSKDVQKMINQSFSSKVNKMKPQQAKTETKEHENQNKFLPKYGRKNEYRKS